uniref:Uncharacterized protein n=1 Tax=Solibacter usitatus (strain Ellin6076) TaxID=234267 RepID=Q01YP2_SOLUE
MFKHLFLSTVLLSAAGLTPTYAGDFSKFNFNIGGGVMTPINPTANYVGLSGNFAVGAGYNINKGNSIIGEFQWNGLPPNQVLQLPGLPFGNINLYSITTNYRRQVERIGHSPFGVYVIAGGGWYYRHISIDKNYVVPPSTVCSPAYIWWGYGCDTGSFIVSETIASKGNSAGGVNAGTGFTIRLSDSGWKFYVESRYNYAFSNRVATTFVPVTFGFRFN